MDRPDPFEYLQQHIQPDDQHRQHQKRHIAPAVENPPVHFKHIEARGQHQKTGNDTNEEGTEYIRRQHRLQLLHHILFSQFYH